MQPNKYQIYAHHLISIVFSGNSQGNIFAHSFCKNVIKIKKIRKIMNRFIYVIKITSK
jgi:hypothetical protein